MHRVLGLFAVCLVGTLGWHEPVFAGERADVNAAIQSGLAWIRAHPATSEEGFSELVDEVLFYSTLERLAGGREIQGVAPGAFEASATRLARSSALQSWREAPDKTLLEHYHFLLATHLLDLAGQKLPGRDGAIEAAQRALGDSGFESPTVRLTVALLLQHLGETPAVAVDRLLEASLSNYAAALGASPIPGQALGLPPFQQTFGYYAVVHEVAALTDFGRLPPSAWLKERRAALSRLLQEGARRAMLTNCVDLLAELLLCNHMLGLPLNGPLLTGVNFLVENQQADGSWGEQKTSRANPTRHAAQTATAALLAYREPPRRQAAMDRSLPLPP